MKDFVENIPFIRLNFEEIIIERLTSDIKCKFLAPNDNLYKIGDKVDGIYVVKTGKL